MMLRTELIEAKSKEFNSRKWSEVSDDLQALLYEHGNIECRWAVVRTAFHGGGVVSKHKSATAALLKARSGKSDCTCGCFTVIPASKIDSLPYASECRSPYTAAR